MTTVGLHATNQVMPKITDAGAPATGKIKIFNDDGTRNNAAWIKPVDTTPITQGYGTVIHPQMLLSSEHLRVSAGQTIIVTDKSNVQSSRTVIATHDVGVNNDVDQFATDLSIALLDSPLPGGIDYAQILPADWYGKWISFVSGAIPAVCIDHEHKTLVTDWYTSDGKFCWFRKPTIPIRIAYYEPLVAGDSSHGTFIIVNNRLVMIECNTSPSGGPDVAVNKTKIEAAMGALLPGAALSVVDLSMFTLGTPLPPPAPPTLPPWFHHMN